MPDSVGADALQDDIVGVEHLAPAVFGAVGNITSIDPDDAAAAGASGLVADAAHQHAYTAATPVKVGSGVADQTNAEGSGTQHVRDTHVHADVSMSTATRVWTDADTILSVGSAVVVNWTTEDYDDGSDFDLSTDTYTVPETGLYEYSCTLQTSTSALGERFFAQALLNGTTVVTSSPEAHGDTSARAGMILHDQRKFTAGDTLKIQARQENGTARNIDGIASRPDFNFFWIRRVG
jgi:hypothetical protein